MTSQMTQATIPMLEILNREAPDGTIYPMVEMLARTDQLLMYADWTRCNANTTMRGARDSTEPSPSDRAYDQGVAKTYGTSTPYEEPTTMIADWVMMDPNKVNDRKDKQAFLDDEYRRHFNGFRKAFGDRVFYGDRTTYPNRLRGFNYRSAYNTASSTYVYDNSGGNASATANKTSVYVMRFGSQHFQFTYPQWDEPGGPVPGNGRIIGVGMGFKTIDFGMDTTTDGDSNEYPVLKTYWQQRFGMVVHDPRAVGRICNISTSSIDEVDDFSFNHLYLYDVLGAFEEAFGDLQNTVIVVPTIVRTQIAKAIDQKSNVFGSIDDPFGRPIAAFNYGVKIPICVSNALVKTESKVA
jgi:hypothetical protein